MLIIAIVLVCLAHFIRTLRWELFVKTYEKPNTKNLLQSLSIGYFINSFIPFKAGDLVRAWISGRKMKNGRGFALATVIVDRYLDILVVGILFAIFSALIIFSYPFFPFKQSPWLQKLLLQISLLPLFPHPNLQK